MCRKGCFRSWFDAGSKAAVKVAIYVINVRSQVKKKKKKKLLWFNFSSLWIMYIWDLSIYLSWQLLRFHYYSPHNIKKICHNSHAQNKLIACNCDNTADTANAESYNYYLVFVMLQFIWYLLLFSLLIINWTFTAREFKKNIYYYKRNKIVLWQRLNNIIVTFI